MKIMIHTCPERLWYVEEFLVPSLIAQGIDDIKVWNDEKRVGNLASCMASFASCSGGETWHMQDDVVICRDFAKRIAEAPAGVVCGFCVERYEGRIVTGVTVPEYMWQSSFPCIKIPDEIAVEFTEWVENNSDRLQRYIKTGKKDDTLFFNFMKEVHAGADVYNAKPHLVEHIDWLIGGSIINGWRDFIPRGMFWEDESVIEELREKLTGR